MPDDLVVGQGCAILQVYALWDGIERLGIRCNIFRVAAASSGKFARRDKHPLADLREVTPLPSFSTTPLISMPGIAGSGGIHSYRPLRRRISGIPTPMA